LLLSWLGAGTSIKSGWAKLVPWIPTFVHHHTVTLRSSIMTIIYDYS